MTKLNKVSSRGVINAAKTLTCDNATKNFEYELQVTENMQPSLVLLASYIKTDGEIIADSKEINVESSIEEKVHTKHVYNNTAKLILNVNYLYYKATFAVCNYLF